jgi:hypothetical protein
MNASITPIRGGYTQPPGTGGKPPRRPRPPKRNGLHLSASDDGEGFGTLDVVNGLHGVCLALDAEAASHSCSDINYVADLAMAARVLSSILQNRVEI